MLSAGFARDAVSAVTAALESVADELAALRRSVDHHAVVTSRPETHAAASQFYASEHGLIKH